MFARVLFLACIVAVASAVPHIPEMVWNKDFVEEINNNQTHWKAGFNAYFEHKSMIEAIRLMGVRSLEPTGAIPTKSVHNEVTLEDIPESFDCRQQWSALMHPVRDQQQCGSCWAFSASEVLTNRFSIASNGSVDVVLSPEDMVSCDTSDYGCQGGMLDTAWAYLDNTGIVTDGCFPYAAGSGVAPACQSKCSDSEQYKKYKSRNSVHFSSVADIQADIMKNGPVQAAFMVYKSFLSYKSGVYHHAWWNIFDKKLGGHAVMIVGWGSENNVPYWIVQNSWSTSWGEDGFFRIRRGSNECQFESMVYAGQADL